MTARALLLASALLASSPAFAEDSASPFSRLRSSSEPAERILACSELAAGPHRGPRAFDALTAAMNRDLSDKVRLAAAVAAITYPGGRTLDLIDKFLKGEPGTAVRRALLVALSTEPAHFNNPDATRIIASALGNDEDVEVRLGAAAALGARGDVLALGAVGRASDRDSSEKVRAAALRSMIILSKPPKPKPAPKPPDPPKPEAIFGVDSCPRPWGWCACAGAIALKPKCLTHEECRSVQSNMRQHSLVCRWDAQSKD